MDEGEEAERREANGIVMQDNRTRYQKGEKGGEEEQGK